MANNKEETIRQLRKQFDTEWAHLFPLTPAPPIRALSSLREEGAGDQKQQQQPPPPGLPFDEWLSSGAVELLANTLASTGQKISQLQDQLARKSYLYEFLRKLIECVDEKQTVPPLPVPVTLATSSALDLNVTPNRQGRSGESGSVQPRFTSSSRDGGPHSRNLEVKNNQETKTQQQQQNSGTGVVNFGKNCDGAGVKEFLPHKSSRVTTTPQQATSFTTGTSETVKKQTTFSPGTTVTSQSLRTGQCGRQGTWGLGEEEEEGKKVCTCATSLTRGLTQTPRQCVVHPPHKPTQKDSSGRKYKKCTTTGEVDRDKHVSVVCVGSGGGVVTEEGNSQQGGSSTTTSSSSSSSGSGSSSIGSSDSSVKTHPTALLKQRGKTPAAAILSHEFFSQQRGAQSLPRRLEPGSKQHTTAALQVTPSLTCATQTDISFNVKEHWVVSSNQDGDMFWNRKKPSSGSAKRGGSDDASGRDRDNSGIFGRHSDVPDLPLPPPRTSSPLQVNYLKLTDGFNIVLDGDGREKKGGRDDNDNDGDDDDVNSGEEDTYDNNTIRNSPRKGGGREEEEEEGGRTADSSGGQVASRSHSGRAVGGGRGVGFDPVRHVSPTTSPAAASSSSSLSSSPSSSSVPKEPVSRARSDTTGVRPSPSTSPSAGQRYSPPSPSRRSKPLPVPRKKPVPPPPVPSKQKPRSVFYVDCETADPVSPLTAAQRGKEEGRSTSSPQDREKGNLADTTSRRGPFDGSPRAVHTPPKIDARARKAQPDSDSYLTPVSARVGQFVPELQRGNEERNAINDKNSTKVAKSVNPQVLTTEPRIPTTSPASQLLRHRADVTEKAADDTWLQSRHEKDTTVCDSPQPSNNNNANVCPSTEIDAEQINQSVTSKTDRDIARNNAGVSDISDMFSLKRHTLSAASDKTVVSGGSPGVYRKNVQPDSTTTTTEHPSGVDPAPHMASSPPPRFQETDIDADLPTVLRSDENESNPPALPAKKKSRQNTYENWTIDRIVTRAVDTTSEEDDEDDDEDDYDTPPSPKTRAKRDESSPTGSKDSGLCLETVQGNTRLVPEVIVNSASDTMKIVVGEMGEKAEGGMRPLGERISSIDELNQLQCEDDDDDEDDYVNLCLPYDDSAEQDNVSIASDIVFVPGSRMESGYSEDPCTSSLHPPRSPGSHTPQDSEDELDSPPSTDVSYDDGDGVDTPVAVASPRDNMLKMRHLLVSSILETERHFLQHLDILVHYKRMLEASCKTSQPVISTEDIEAIFSNLQKLQEVHKEFVDGLQKRVDDWSPEQTIGDVFKLLVVMFPHSGEYAENYPTAVATIHRCCQESPRFQEVAEQIVMTTLGQKETPSLEGALFKPVQRMQRNSLVLFDLIKHTPEDHEDYGILKKALDLSQMNLENFGTTVDLNKAEKRILVKSSFVVELVSGWRKLRFIFLFSDLLVCTKMEHHRGGKVTFDCKWFIPMSALSLVTKRGYEDDMKFSKKDEIDELKKKLQALKAELKKETKKDENKDQKLWGGIAGIASSRHIEKLKKKIKELERDLILSSPKLPFKVWCDSVKPHTLLMTTDYEREEWREVLTSLRRRSVRIETTPPSAFEVQEIVNSVKELPEVNRVGSMLAETDEEVIYGTLNVTIHKLNGLKDACDTYCCLEMDSLGHFFMKARTHICPHSLDPSWNEDFELELEGSQTLRILCYRKLPDKQGDVLLGRGALEMSKQWLKGTFQEKTVAMNEYSLVLSVRYTAAEQTMRRTPSRHNHAVFGVKISTCAKREGKTVPTIVTACVQDVEKRGLDEMGIYRVSGTTSDVQKLKKYFDKNVKTGVNALGDMPVHSVTSMLKLYLRELPEPLFTEASYTNFVDALKLSDAEGKEKCMLSLLHNLPDINYYTAVYLLEHMHIVSKNEKENKMTINNLSTIFGPTLLAPAVKETGYSMSEMMSIGTEQCMKQSAVIYYFLNFLVKGGDLRRSSPT
ncbi:uncharacterized protein LOC143274737 [Babylonia areolata]|uniref:uncharacterized protein LOC143274737 n=1 Tax=Babylonia areolata TaxID=304850 RepID=UPI003FD03E9F